MKRGRAQGSGSEPARSDSVETRFTPAEVRQLARLADAEDRSMGGTVHWIVRRFLRGQLVAKGGGQ